MTQTITLDIIPSGDFIREVIRLKQGDNLTRTIAVKLTNGGSPFTVPVGSTVRLRGTKVDGTGFMIPSSGYSQADGYTFVLSNDNLGVAGLIKCDVAYYYSSGDDIPIGSTELFYIDAVQTALDPHTYTGGNDYPDLLAATARALSIEGVRDVANIPDQTISYSSVGYGSGEIKDGVIRVEGYGAGEANVYEFSVELAPGKYLYKLDVKSPGLTAELVQVHLDKRYQSGDVITIPENPSVEQYVAIILSETAVSEGYSAELEPRVFPYIPAIATVTPSSSASITLTEDDTVYLTNVPTALSVTLPAPKQGRDFLCGVNFKAGAGFALTETAPTGYSVHWETAPGFFEGTIYEIIYRCLWIKDGNNKYIISAKCSEVNL